MERQRSNKNLQTTRPAQNFAGTKKFDPEKLHTLPAPAPAPEPEVGPMGTAKVARGRCLHVPTGKKVVVGSRPFEVNGAIVYRDVTADETRSALPGDVVSMPQQEIDRLMALNFLIPIDDQPRKGMKVKPVRPQTGIDNDPRVKGTNSLTNGTR